MRVPILTAPVPARPYLTTRAVFADARGTLTPIDWPDGFHPTQVNVVTNPQPRTLRGLHFQCPHAQAKLLTVLHGSVYDVVVNVETGHWSSVLLLSLEGRTLYVPKGYAHGYLTLQPDTVVLYAVEGRYDRASEQGYRWDDPAIGIEWPATPALVSDRDAHWPLVTGWGNTLTE